MVTISIFYPHTPDSTFDMEYYLGTHMPMSRERLGAHPSLPLVTKSYVRDLRSRPATFQAGAMFAYALRAATAGS